MKKNISKLLLLVSATLSVPMICSVVAKSSPKLKRSTGSVSNFNKFTNAMGLSRSHSLGRITRNSNSNSSTSSGSSSGSGKSVFNRVSLSDGELSKFKTSMHRTFSFSGGNKHKGQVPFKTSSQPTTSRESILNPTDEVTSSGLVEIKKGANGTTHHIQVTSNTTYTETYNSKGDLILKSKRGAQGLTTEWIDNGKVTKREVRTPKGTTTTKFDNSGKVIETTKLSR